jgi:photosystem II stability/assembly factor-like uncharacterized protein
MFVISSGAAIRSSPDGQVAWVTRLSLSSNYASGSGVAFGNGLFIVPGQVDAMGNFNFSYSADGIVWNQATSKVSTVSSGTGINSISFVSGMFVAVATHGTVLVSADGLNWQRLPTGLPINTPLYAVAATAEGGFVVFGQGGLHFRFGRTSVDRELGALGSYKMLMAAMPLNPKTGMPWTPSEAANAHFGMKVSS